MIRPVYWLSAFTFFLFLSAFLLIEKGHDASEHGHTSSAVKKLVVDRNITELEILSTSLAEVESKTRIVLEDGSWPAHR